ncbi:hypothetical protein IGK74_000157 [Enterococcus sp. AZ150]
MYLLGVKRLVNLLNPERIVPQTSVISVNIDREQIEEIRKTKGIYVRTFEKKINLSKSRYYRWLNYEIDLPMEYLVSITKLLGLSSIEFKDLFVNSTDELIQLLSLTIDVSFRTTELEKETFTTICSELEKFRASKEDTQLYQLILIFCDLVKSIQDKREDSQVNYHINRIESYLAKSEYLTLYDMVLYLGLMKVKEYYRLPITYVEENMDSFCRTLLAKIKPNRLVEGRSFILGSIIDLSMLLASRFDSKTAFQFLVQAKEKIVHSWKVTSRDLELLECALVLHDQHDQNHTQRIQEAVANIHNRRIFEEYSDEEEIMMAFLMGSI